jgi:hypothetical protein
MPSEGPKKETVAGLTAGFSLPYPQTAPRRSIGKNTMSAVDSYDSEMNDVWRELKITEEPDSREFLLERLAEFALNQHDFSDVEIGDDVHEYFEELRQARETYHLTAVRVGRFVARTMENTETLGAMRSHAVDDPSSN